MNIRKPLFLLLLFVGACSTDSHSPSTEDVGQWQQTVEKLTTLLKKEKFRETENMTKIKLAELLVNVNDTEKNDTLIKYARQILSISYYNYLKSKQFRSGIEYMDSLSQIPFIQENCKHELLSARASMHQMYGDNEQAIELANEYLQLPDYEDTDRFIPQAEIISGVYIYSGKAVAINQEAISSYTDSIAPPNIVIAYGEQANLYAELGMYDRALQLNTKAQHYSLLKDSFGLGDLYRYRAAIFGQTGIKDSIFYYLNQAEKISALQGSFKGVFVNKVTTVEAYLDYTDSVQKALTLALSICPDSSRMPQWAKYELELHLGRALLQTGKATQGIPLIEKAAQGFISMDMRSGKQKANNILMDYYLSMNMNDAFVRCYKRSQTFTDSLNLAEKMRAVAAANIRFDTERKEKENTLLSAQVKLQKQQLFYNICISITLLLTLIISVAYFINKRKSNRLLLGKHKQEIKKLITRQQELNRRNEQLTEQIEQAMATNNLTSIRQLTGQNLLSKEDENDFRQSFAVIHPLYLPRLREYYPQLTRNEELLAMLICMNQSTDEIALIMGINRNSVNMIRSRMRKNIGLAKEESLDEVVKQFLS